MNTIKTETQNSLIEKLYEQRFGDIRYENISSIENLERNRLEESSVINIGNLQEYDNLSLRQVRERLVDERVTLLNKLPFKLSEREIKKGQYLEKLIKYELGHFDELNKNIARYKDAIRINILNEYGYRMIKNPSSILLILKYLSLTTGRRINYGLKHVPDKGKTEYVPFTIDYSQERTDGIFYIDQNRPLSVNNIFAIEKILKKTNLSGAIIIANQVGLPAKRFINRYNEEREQNNQIHIIQFDSLLKEIKQ